MKNLSLVFVLLAFIAPQASAINFTACALNTISGVRHYFATEAAIKKLSREINDAMGGWETQLGLSVQQNRAAARPKLIVARDILARSKETQEIKTRAFHHFALRLEAYSSRTWRAKLGVAVDGSTVFFGQDGDQRSLSKAMDQFILGYLSGYQKVMKKFSLTPRNLKITLRSTQTLFHQQNYKEIIFKFYLP